MAEKSYPIAVRVYDGASILLKDVNINLINTSNSEMLDATKQKKTDSNGEASVNGADLTTDIVTGQPYEVIFSKVGYETYKVVGVFSEGADSIVIDLMREGVSNAHFEKDEVNLRLAQAKVTFHIWSNDYEGDGTDEVVTDGGGMGRGITDTKKPVINLKPGMVCYVRFMGLRLNTASKNAILVIVKCSEKDGGGTATTIGHIIHDFTGTNVERGEYLQHDHIFPIRIPYNKDSAKSVALQLTTSTSSVDVDMNAMGYVLEE